MIELRGVTRSFGATRAVRDLDLRVPPGKTTALIGPSGCGKSTVLRLMLGLIRPDAGRVLFDGEDLGPAALPAVRRRTGYVIQDGGLFPHLTGRGNVTLMARQLGWSRQRIDERLAELTELTALPAATLARYPAEVSGGQRQRIALMRALMLDPDFLLLDEPLGALDRLIRHDLQQDLRAIFTCLGKTVVLVTHDLDEAAYLGDRLVLMERGRIVQSGSLAALVERPADPFVTRFVSAQRPRPSERPS